MSNRATLSLPVIGILTRPELGSPFYTGVSWWMGYELDLIVLYILCRLSSISGLFRLFSQSKGIKHSCLNTIYTGIFGRLFTYILSYALSASFLCFLYGLSFSHFLPFFSCSKFVFCFLFLCMSGLWERATVSINNQLFKFINCEFIA